MKFIFTIILLLVFSNSVFGDDSQKQDPHSKKLDEIILKLDSGDSVARMDALKRIAEMGLEANTAVAKIDRFLLSSQCNTRELKEQAIVTLNAIGASQGTPLVPAAGTVQTSKGGPGKHEEPKYEDLIEERKQAIYLYPTKKTAVTIELPSAVDVHSSYPPFSSGIRGWKLNAFPDGSLTDNRGRNYDYLFWEGALPVPPVFDREDGMVVQRNNLLASLES